MFSFITDGAIGRMLAPPSGGDLPVEPVESNDKLDLWQFFAPDPAYAKKVNAEREAANLDSYCDAKQSGSSSVPPSEAFLSPGLIVKCVHCNQLTPSCKPQATEPTRKDQFKTPPPPDKERGGTDSEELHARNMLERSVLSAAKETAASLNSPPAVISRRHKLFRLCGSTKPLKESALEKLRNLLSSDKSLIRCRAKNLGELAPDSYTPLMAAAYAGNMGAARIILKMDETPHGEVDVYGKTAIHVASEHGNFEMLKLLRGRCGDGDSLDTFVDITGRTPLGVALTSPNPKAKKNHAELNSLLFSPTDSSILGSQEPIQRRHIAVHSLQMAFARSEMPGCRVLMEDAFCSSTWQNEFMDMFCLLVVCDGHGDSGNVSKFVAHNISILIKEKTMSFSLRDTPPNWEELWNGICLEVDIKLKNGLLPGGSTAIAALITSEQIIVVNVGDSRAIMVQRMAASGGAPTLVEELSSAHQSATSNKGDADVAELSHSSIPADEEAAESAFAVTAMSQDHKPCLERETKRIEHAGLSVVNDRFQLEDDGPEVMISKVCISGTNKMAVSRSFGDFEYKAAKHLGPEEQAVVPIPDVRIHTRVAERDLFLVLACDGVWDVMSNKEVARFIFKEVEETPGQSFDSSKLPRIGDKLLQQCLNRGSKDNMTVAIVALAGVVDNFDGDVLHGKALTFASPQPK